MVRNCSIIKHLNEIGIDYLHVNALVDISREVTLKNVLKHALNIKKDNSYSLQSAQNVFISLYSFTFHILCKIILYLI